MLTEMTHSCMASKMPGIHSSISPSDVLEELFYLILINSLFSKDSLKNYGNVENKDDSGDGGLLIEGALFSIG